VRSVQSRDLGATLERVEPQDLITYDLIPEFVGRLPVVGTLHGRCQGVPFTWEALNGHVTAETSRRDSECRRCETRSHSRQRRRIRVRSLGAESAWQPGRN
jgi:hypothetical protein